MWPLQRYNSSPLPLPDYCGTVQYQLLRHKPFHGGLTVMFVSGTPRMDLVDRRWISNVPQSCVDGVGWLFASAAALAERRRTLSAASQARRGEAAGNEPEAANARATS